MEQINEASVQKEGGARLKKGGKGLYIALGVIVLALAGTYLGLCAYAGSLGTFYPNTTINGVAVGGLTPAEAAGKLREAVLNNCRDGRRWRYELLDVPTISRAEFYRRKREFLRDVAQRCGIW